MTTEDRRELKQTVEKQAARMEQAERDRPTLLAQVAYLGTLGLLFVLPVIAGAYLGRWLDSLLAGYSIRWTISMIVIGLVVGAINVYLFVRR
jgi:ATP synthase protein I